MNMQGIPNRARRAESGCVRFFFATQKMRAGARATSAGVRDAGGGDAIFRQRRRQKISIGSQGLFVSVGINQEKGQTPKHFTIATS
jgi:hypothetical protein